PTHLLFRYNREICTRRTCVRCTLHRGRPPQLWRGGDIDARTRAIDRFIFPSARTESVYRAQGIGGAGTVMHHFLPDEYFEAAAARGARDGAAEPYFLYVGRMDAVKGVEGLVRHFTCNDSGAPLFLVGDGPIAPDLRRRFGDHPRIRFLGSRSPAELGELYRDALALLLPSAGYEVFGLVVLEAFAHGTPAAVTDVTGAAELVRAAQGGFVYGSDAELADALRQLSDPGVRERLGASGRHYAREAHREDDYIDRYEQLIREMRAP
ncbi:MAG: glycosyltransferase family 4 protein, partial [Acidobacteriota bacterium]